MNDFVLPEVKLVQVHGILTITTSKHPAVETKSDEVRSMQFSGLAAEQSVARAAINDGIGRQRANTLDAFKGDDLESNYMNRTAPVALLQSQKQIVIYPWIKLNFSLATTTT